jgi:hypothetical protein
MPMFRSKEGWCAVGLVYLAIGLILQELSDHEPDAQAPNANDAREERWLAMRFAHDEPVPASDDSLAQGGFLDRINEAFGSKWISPLNDCFFFDWTKDLLCGCYSLPAFRYTS